MTIQAVFRLGGDQIIIEVDGNNVMFCELGSGSLAPIEGLQLNRPGVIKEFPDLKDDDEWRKKAIERFKQHIKSFNTENERINYVIEDLRKYGYAPLFKRRNGFRPEKIK